MPQMGRETSSLQGYRIRCVGAFNHEGPRVEWLRKDAAWLAAYGADCLPNQRLTAAHRALGAFKGREAWVGGRVVKGTRL